MAISNEGYKDLRQHVETTWKYVAIISDNGAELSRLQVGVDTGVTISDDYTINPLTIQAVLTGTQMGINTKVQGLKLYNVATNGTALVEVTYASYFQFQNADDELTLRETIQIPAIV